MSLKTKQTPYQGLGIFLLIMLLPSVAITALMFAVISKWQPQYGWEVNWASAKVIGCGVGVLFHCICWMMGAFTEDFRAVKMRLKEFFANIIVSAELAFSCWWDDVKSLGMAFWIDCAIIALNMGVFVDALIDFLTLRGFV